MDSLGSNQSYNMAQAFNSKILGASGFETNFAEKNHMATFVQDPSCLQG